jgi:hypothetical protein
MSKGDLTCRVKITDIFLNPRSALMWTPQKSSRTASAGTSMTRVRSNAHGLPVIIILHLNVVHKIDVLVRIEHSLNSECERAWEVEVYYKELAAEKPCRSLV